MPNVKWEVEDMSIERDDIVVLVDENDEEVEFEYLDTVEFDDNEYVVLLPMYDQEEEEREIDEVVILKIEHGEEDSFVSIDDDNELAAVFEEFRSRMESEYEFEE